MEDTLFRSFRKNDLSAIAALHNSHYDSTVSHSRLARTIHPEITFVVEQNRTVIGFMLTEEFAPDIVQLTDLLINSSTRNKGLGSSFLAWCETELSTTYKAVILVTSTLYETANNISPRRFYEKNGYSLIQDTGPSATYVKDL